jgi:N6-adenosine-specific RNA methylase IME4
VSFFFAPLKPRSFDLVHIDFPWPWETWSNAGRKKSPQYECMQLDEITQTDPQDLLTPSGVMVLWLTWPLIAKQSMIIENCFGLEIKTGGVWSKRTVNGKIRWGTGHIIRNVCDPFVIACRRGHKLRGRSVTNLIETLEAVDWPGVARENSRKPEEMFQLLDSLTVGWKKVDVFSRQSRRGWSTWGNEKTKFDKK